MALASDMRVSVIGAAVGAGVVFGGAVCALLEVKRARGWERECEGARQSASGLLALEVLSWLSLMAATLLLSSVALHLPRFVHAWKREMATANCPQVENAPE